MLASFLVSLKPAQPARLGSHVGRSLHGLFFNLVREANPALAEQLHGPLPIKPFTVSTLMGRFAWDRGQPVATPDEVYRVRYTVLADEVFEALGQVLLGRYLEQRSVTIDGQPFEIQGIDAGPRETGGWAEMLAYEELFRRRRQDRELRLHFASPTAFKTGDVSLLFPLPRSVFGSYRRTWEAFAGIPLSEDLMAFVEQHVTVSRYDLETRTIQAGSFPLIGFVGRCTYRILEADPLHVAELNALADFALFAGTGMKTTQGMGQTRRVPERGAER